MMLLLHESRLLMGLFAPLSLAIVNPIRAPANAGTSQPIPSLYKGINSKYGVINETGIPPCFNPSNTLTTRRSN